MNPTRHEKFKLDRRVEEQFGRQINQRNRRNRAQISHNSQKRFLCSDQRLFHDSRTHRGSRRFWVPWLCQSALFSHPQLFSLKHQNQNERGSPKQTSVDALETQTRKRQKRRPDPRPGFFKQSFRQSNPTNAPKRILQRPKPRNSTI